MNSLAGQILTAAALQRIWWFVWTVFCTSNDCFVCKRKTVRFSV